MDYKWKKIHGQLLHPSSLSLLISQEPTTDGIVPYSPVVVSGGLFADPHNYPRPVAQSQHSVIISHNMVMNHHDPDRIISHGVIIRFGWKGDLKRTKIKLFVASEWYGPLTRFLFVAAQCPLLKGFVFFLLFIFLPLYLFYYFIFPFPLIQIMIIIIIIIPLKIIPNLSMASPP